MPYDVEEVVTRGPEQDRKVVLLRLTDGTEITSECAIAMINNQGVRFRHRTSDGWKTIEVIHKIMWTTELAA